MSTNAVLAPPSSRVPDLPQVELLSPVTRADPFDDPAWLFEPGYDGLPAVLYQADRSCTIEVFGDLSVEVEELGSRVAEVLGSRDAILAGQIVALDRRGKPVLQQLLRGEGYLAFAAVDLLWLDGSDLRDQPLKARKERLAELLPEDTGPLYKVLAIEEHGRALFAAIKRMDLPGIVAKCLHDPYGPATVWYEIRNPGCPDPEGRAEGARHRARQRRPTPIQ
jgi:bifunctional non-homologous end joining protein LigD